MFLKDGIGVVDNNEEVSLLNGLTRPNSGSNAVALSRLNAVFFLKYRSNYDVSGTTLINCCFNMSNVHADAIDNGDTDIIDEAIEMSDLTESYFKAYKDTFNVLIKNEHNGEEAFCYQDSN